MGSFANTLFTILMGWLQAAAAAIWSAFTTENGGAFLQWIGRNWIILTVILCIIGMITDFGIYLVRWRPLRVWKSFFNRLRHREEQPEEAEQPAEKPIASGSLFKHEDKTVADRGIRSDTTRIELEDFSRWKTEETEQNKADEIAQKRPVITGAGYIVPEDSPYRRPVVPKPDENNNDLIPDIQQSPKPEIMTQRRRRRKLIVGDLFNDPEEELFQYERPQQLIDKDQAYHEPVYPRGWKKDEGEDK